MPYSARFRSSSDSGRAILYVSSLICKAAQGTEAQSACSSDAISHQGLPVFIWSVRFSAHRFRCCFSDRAACLQFCQAGYAATAAATPASASSHMSSFFMWLLYVRAHCRFSQMMDYDPDSIDSREFLLHQQQQQQQ